MSDTTNQHDLIRALRDLAIALGRTPTQAEFYKTLRGAKYKVEKAFTTFSALVQASGLEPSHHSRVKLTNDIFKTDITNHLQRYEPKEKLRPPVATIACISDIHWPFSNQKVLDRFYKYVGDNKPEYVILDGDAWDMYSHTKFPRSHNVFTPEDEEKMARKMNEDFWKEIKKVHPEAKCYQMLGNHDVRPLKRTMEVAPTIEHWLPRIFGALFTFPGVTTVLDPREELMLPGDIMIHHGYRGKLGDHRDFALYNAICGHTHRGGVVFREIRGATLWELNCGLAGDPLAKGLTYTPQRITGWTPGFGAVDEDGPRFIWV